MKLHRKIKHDKKVCRAQNNSKTEENLPKLHGKIIYNYKVCHTQELRSYAQGQSHNQVKIMSKQSLGNYLAKFNKTLQIDRT